MNIKFPVISISSAVAFADIELLADIIKAHVNKEYRYLTAMPIFEDGSYAAMCSKDMKNWSICASATDVNGEPIDVREFAIKVEQCILKIKEQVKSND